MTLSVWQSIDVALPVAVVVVDGETVTGNVHSSNRLVFLVAGEHETRWFPWPACDDRVLGDSTNGTVKAGDQLTWIDGRDRTITLTIRREEPCAG